MFGALSAPAAAQSLVSSFPEVCPLSDAARGLREGRPGTTGQGHDPPRNRYSHRRRLRPVNFPRGRWEFWETRRSAKGAVAPPPPQPGRGSD